MRRVSLNVVGEINSEKTLLVKSVEMIMSTVTACEQKRGEDNFGKAMDNTALRAPKSLANDQPS